MLISAKTCHGIILFELEIYVFILLLSVSTGEKIAFSRRSCINANHSCTALKLPDQDENAVCYEDQICSELDSRSSCNLFSSFTLLNSILKEVKVFQNGQESHIELVLDLSPHSTNGFPTSGTFVFEVLLGTDSCHKFSLQSSRIPQGSFNLPCLRAELVHGHLELQLSTSFGREDEGMEMLSSHKQNYVISNFNSLQSFKMETLHLSYSFDHLKFYLKLQNVASYEREMSYQVALYDHAVDVHDLEDKPVYTWIGVADSTLLVLNCTKRMLEYFKKYCISVSLKPFATRDKRSGNRQEMFIFQYIPQNHLFGDNAFSPLCRHWNVSMLLKSDSSMQKISVLLRLCTGMEKLSRCFKFYQLQLYHFLRSRECHPTSGIIFDSTELVIPYNKTVGKIFSELPNGYYCILLVPCSRNGCYEEQSLHSNVVRISALPHSRGIDDHPSTTASSFTVLVMAIVSSVFLIFFVALLLLLRYRHKRKLLTLSTSNPNTKSDKIEELLTVSDSSAEVLLLYYPDPETTRQVSLLREFLSDCAGMRVAALDEDLLPEVMVNRAVAMQRILRYRCLSVGGTCDSDKRFVVVESRTAMEFLQCRLQEDKRRQWHQENSSNELECSLFCEAVSTLLSDWRKCLGDYCHLFVVRFDDPLRYEAEIPLTTFDRYDLPRDLVRLCLNLGCSVRSMEMLEQRKEAHPINHL